MRKVAVRNISDDAPVRGELEKLIIGGIGGMAPIVVTLLAGEYENAVGQEAAYLYYIGLCLRALLFFGVGAFFVWLHQAIRTRYAVFQLGIAAPALIVAMAHATPAASADTLSDSTSEVRAALEENAKQSAVMLDALPPGTFYANCSILDGILGRECGK